MQSKSSRYCAPEQKTPKESKEVGPTTHSIRWWGQRFPWLTLRFVLSLCVWKRPNGIPFQRFPHTTPFLSPRRTLAQPHTAFYLQSVRVRKKQQLLKFQCKNKERQRERERGFEDWEFKSDSLKLGNFEGLWKDWKRKSERGFDLLWLTEWVIDRSTA